MTTDQEILIKEQSRSSSSPVDDKDDIYMAIEALGQLKNSQQVPPPTQQHSSPSIQETFLDKVTSHPLISSSIKMIEKNIQDNKRRWFQEEPQKLQNLKELSFANLNIESRRKLQMLINFLKLGNKQLNARIENLSQICEQERLRKLGLTAGTTSEADDQDDEEFHDASDDSKKLTQFNTSQTPSPEFSTPDNNSIATESPQQEPQEIKSEIVGTVKKIVKVVSRFTGNSLPEPARSHVRELLLKLPNNWAAQKDLISKDQLDPNGKVLVLAQESLEMIKKILNLCNENLNSLENWNHIKVEEQKYLKEKILIKNHHHYIIEDKIEERRGEEELEDEDEQAKKRIKIGINDLVNSEQVSATTTAVEQSEYSEVHKKASSH